MPIWKVGMKSYFPGRKNLLDLDDWTALFFKPWDTSKDIPVLKYIFQITNAKLYLVTFINLQLHVHFQLTHIRVIRYFQSEEDSLFNNQ